MKFASNDNSGSANGIASLALLKMLLETMINKKMLNMEELEIILSCAMIEIATNEGSGDQMEAKGLIETLLKNTDDVEQTKQ